MMRTWQWTLKALEPSLPTSALSQATVAYICSNRDFARVERDVEKHQRHNAINVSTLDVHSYQSVSSIFGTARLTQLTLAV